MEVENNNNNNNVPTFRDVTKEDKSSGDKLINKIISIYWDGDKIYYPCEILSYDSNSNIYNVKYFGGNEEDNENLVKTKWRLWTGTKDEFLAQYEPPEDVSLFIYIYIFFTLTC